jgi:hypothetical protein
MLALRQKEYNGTTSPTEFYIGGFSKLDWLMAAQEDKEDREQKARSLQHMRRYTCANFLGRFFIVIMDAFERLTRSTRRDPIDA